MSKIRIEVRFSLYLDFFLELVDSEIISISRSHEIRKFMEDQEHGFLHGLVTGFWSFMQFFSDSCLDLQNECLKLYVVSSFFHDFLKTNGQIENHDRDLVRVFPYLCESAYSHSKPDKKYEQDLLVVSDRIELHRYPDSMSWIDYDILKTSCFYVSHEDTIRDFYKNLFPFLNECCVKKNFQTF
jgi:hypothetical protein